MHVIDANVTHIQVWYLSNYEITILVVTAIGTISELRIASCYIVDPAPKLTAVSASPNPTKLI